MTNSDQTMFDDENKQEIPPTTPVTPQTDPFVDKLMLIKNEKGEPKYKTVDDALVALAHSQKFIEDLKAEKRATEEALAAERAEREKLGNIDEFVKKLNPNAKPTQPPATPANEDGLSEERVAQLLETTLQKREREKLMQNNLATVQEQIAATHGEKATDFIRNRAKELNTTPAALKELAMTNPTMAMTLLGGGSAKPNPTPSQPSLTKPAIAPKDANVPPRVELGKGVTRGGLSNKELAERFRQSKEFTNKRIGLES